MAEYMPYTYFISWSNTGMKYYGVRYKKGCTPKDFWVSYKTSSNYVKKYIEENGEPDIKEIRKIFVDGSQAREWESRVLTRINATVREDYLNKWARNIAHPELSSANMSVLRQDVQFETKRQQGLKQYNDSDAARRFRSKVLTERNRSDKAKKKSSELATLRNYSLKECLNCHKEFNLGNFVKHTRSMKCQKEKNND